METGKVFHSKLDTLGGTPVFVDTRVPVKALFDYLEHGHDVALFLDDFPSVTRERAEKAIVLARDSLLSKVVETAARGVRSQAIRTDVRGPYSPYAPTT